MRKYPRGDPLTLKFSLARIPSLKLAAEGILPAQRWAPRDPQTGVTGCADERECSCPGGTVMPFFVKPWRARLSCPVALASLVGCSGGFQGAPPLSPVGPLATHPASRATSTAGHASDLLYVTDSQDGDVYMISLPSGRPAGKITGFYQLAGDCADGQGDVFIADSGNSAIREYRHGAKVAFNVLNDRPWVPSACAVDPVSGNLAVANCCGTRDVGSVAVYAEAKGQPRYHRFHGMQYYYYCAYDSRGDLFADGVTAGSDNFELLEIPHGAHALRSVTLTPPIAGEAGLPLAWDGSYLDIANPSSNRIDRYTVSGDKGSLADTVNLQQASGVIGPFWIASSGKTKTLYAPIVEDSIPSVGVYRYPAGGEPIKTLYDVIAPFAAALSVR